MHWLLLLCKYLCGLMKDCLISSWYNYENTNNHYWSKLSKCGLLDQQYCIEDISHSGGGGLTALRRLWSPTAPAPPPSPKSPRQPGRSAWRVRASWVWERWSADPSSGAWGSPLEGGLWGGTGGRTTGSVLGPMRSWYLEPIVLSLPLFTS